MKSWINCRLSLFQIGYFLWATVVEVTLATMSCKTLLGKEFFHGWPIFEEILAWHCTGLGRLAALIRLNLISCCVFFGCGGGNQWNTTSTTRLDDLFAQTCTFVWKIVNNNKQKQFFRACKNEHAQQTIALKKNTGQQPDSGHCWLVATDINGKTQEPISFNLVKAAGVQNYSTIFL